METKKVLDEDAGKIPVFCPFQSSISHRASALAFLAFIVGTG